MQGRLLTAITSPLMLATGESPEHVCDTEATRDVSQERMCFPIPQINQARHSADTFRSNIRAFVTSSSVGSSYTITKICEKFKFQRRRLYDVVNVLESVGCCKKASIDSITWNGIDGVVPMLIEQQVAWGVDNGSATLSHLFQEERCISIGHLTLVYMMMFFALRQKCLDIRSVAMYLSRNNGRFKTTLCKLYQISHILEAAGIIKRGALAGETTIGDRFFQFPNRSCISDAGPMSIDLLLSRPREDLVNWVQSRRDEFSDIVRTLDVKSSPPAPLFQVMPVPVCLYV